MLQLSYYMAVLSFNHNMKSMQCFRVLSHKAPRS
ncbi:hypothetical protein SLEP1_g44498 [Rubroshorea leprosula]|uniref:Uncharacterized protein n=1 Tax=Rubroshorea leprosula TaxID=152421 RepID=A0AAV5LI92_9ROSI|nr:hypothetical protein SLEP1_g44498 [Rubroshorea leprosula]